MGESFDRPDRTFRTPTPRWDSGRVFHRSALDREADDRARTGAVHRPQQDHARLDGAGLLGLQRTAGNAAVTQHVQRYAVGVPATADHKTLMAWMTDSNPYAGEGAAAKTKAAFRYHVAWVAKGEPGNWTVTPSAAAKVTMTKSVDMPVWVAQDKALQANWAAGVSALRTHEGTHEALADTWRTTLEARVKAFTATSSGANETEAGKDAGAQLATEWQTWLGEHDTAQAALDPYYVTVVDPHPRAAPAPPPAPDAESTESE